MHSRAAGHADASLPKRSRGGLKIHCRQLRVGSNPTAGTLDGRPVRRTAGVPLAPSGVVLCPLRLWLRQFEASATRLAGRCKPGSVPVCLRARAFVVVGCGGGGNATVKRTPGLNSFGVAPFSCGIAAVRVEWCISKSPPVIAWSRVYGCLCGAVARAKALCSQRCGRLKTLISVYGALTGFHTRGGTGRRRAELAVGSRSQAGCLKRNTAMDASIGGS